MRFLGNLFLLVWLLALASRATAQPELYARGQADGLALAGPELFWKAGCGDDFTPPLSYVRATEAVARAGRLSVVRPLFQPPACGRDRVASRNLAVDDTHVYWIAADRRLVRVPRGATRASPEALITVSPALEPGYSLAAGGGWIVWTDGAGVYRTRSARLEGDPVDTLLAPAAPGTPGSRTGLSDVHPSGDGYVLRRGSRLVRLAPVPGAPRRFNVIDLPASEGVTAFTIAGDRIYLAAPRAEGAYAIAAIARDGTHTTYYTSPPGRAGDRIDQIAVAGSSLYWHVDNRSGGPIMRLRIGDLRPTRLSADIRMSAESRLATTGEFLFWTVNEGIMRVATGAPAVAAPDGDVWITGVEWVQVVQTPNNEVPMIAGKPTAIRVYARSREDSNGPWRSVTAQLRVEGSRLAHNLGPVALRPAGSDRRTLEGSFMFSLRPEETLPGTRRIRVTLTPGDFRPESDTSNNSRTFDVLFAPRIDVPLYVFTWTSTNNSRCTATGHPPPPDGTITSWEDVVRDARSAENILPISSLPLRRVAASGRSFDNADCEAFLRARDFLMEEIDRLRPPAGTFAVSMNPPGGDTHEHGSCCFETAGRNWVMLIHNPGRPNYTLAHELGHFYGLIHPWELNSGYPRMPFETAPVGDMVGVDLYSSPPRLVLGQDAMGRSLISDLMTDAAPRTSSLFTYCRALRRLSQGRTLCPASVEGGGP